MRVALASDHGGYLLKEELKKALTEWGFSIVDVGCGSLESV
ncbi:MAG TPA: RpiB/LacA/LacB family sugar-phosphate isomerase, partial [Firmicutes bacterium]|nr:RpiB/LacA/LacB family sugar-phosphate isomerase [Bacillota bacterium]